MIMSTMEDEENLLETVLQRHRKEKKELQAEIQSLKNSVTKGNKKKKKEVAEEIAKLELELEKRQAKELEETNLKVNGEIVQELKQLDINNESSGTINTNNDDEKSVRLTKAQKRRDKKSMKEKERAKQIAEEERENQFGPRNMEQKKIKSLLKERNLALYEVPSNGDCLYTAIQHQLLLHNRSPTVEELRKTASQYMLTHPGDFMPFMSNPNNDEPFTEDDFAKYCNEVAISSSAWGSQTEIQALSEALKLGIEVLQADGPILKVGECDSGPSILITYHRHAYGLGEHYNSVKQRVEEESEEDKFPDDDTLTNAS